MPELLASSEQDYLDKAHRLARDRSYREALKATLQERRSRLFANQAAVVELTQVLKQMAQ
jgi:predicted O-linked N-acetylglucosamine transferase (SPINDLY family)